MKHSGDPKEAFDALVKYISGFSPVCVAFSGGVDSSVVALAAHRASPRGSLAVTAVSELCPETEASKAGLIAGSIGIEHRLVYLELLENDGIAANPPERCYRCKKAIIAALERFAEKNGIKNIIEGSNADDTGNHRPGIKALREAGVISPLMELGIGKRTVREIARLYGLPNHNKPSSPCLATRFPYGTRLTKSKIRRVRMAEDYVRSLGFPVLRVRDHGEIARIELPPKDMERLLSREINEKIVVKLAALGYNYVTLDLKGFRSGSMDEPGNRGRST